MEEKPNYYAVIPANVRYDNELRPNEKLLYGEISALANKTGVCYANNEYFSELYDVQVNAISTWIKHLKEKEYIKVEYEYETGTKEIKKRYISLGGIQKDNTWYSKRYEGGIQKGEDNNTSINNTKEIYKERFETFYKEYPKKVSKQKTLQWFIKHKPDEELFNKIMSSLQKQKKTKSWLKDNGQYIPFPTTWLNGERWEDEIDIEDNNEDRRVYF